MFKSPFRVPLSCLFSGRLSETIELFLSVTPPPQPPNFTGDVALFLTAKEIQ